MLISLGVDLGSAAASPLSAEETECLVTYTNGGVPVMLQGFFPFSPSQTLLIDWPASVS